MNVNFVRYRLYFTQCASVLLCDCVTASRSADPEEVHIHAFCLEIGDLGIIALQLFWAG